MIDAVDSEQIVLVDEAGKPIGKAPKLASHHASTPLHLAFSVYIFNDNNELLVTKRAHQKKVWPDVWTNSCCGHPMPGESMEQAIVRRVEYELGMTVKDIKVALPDYRYTTPPYNGIIENEVCPVFMSRANSVPRPNPKEVDDIRWISWGDFRNEALADSSNAWSWWCKDQLSQLETKNLKGVL